MKVTMRVLISAILLAQTAMSIALWSKDSRTALVCLLVSLSMFCVVFATTGAMRR